VADRNALIKPTLQQMAPSAASEYRENAALCEKQAEQAPNSHFAEEYRKLARQWRAMAEHAEHNGF
jgi:hypothetical protein